MKDAVWLVSHVVSLCSQAADWFVRQYQRYPAFSIALVLAVSILLLAHYWLQKHNYLSNETHKRVRLCAWMTLLALVTTAVDLNTNSGAGVGVYACLLPLAMVERSSEQAIDILEQTENDRDLPYDLEGASVKREDINRVAMQILDFMDSPNTRDLAWHTLQLHRTELWEAVLARKQEGTQTR